MTSPYSWFKRYKQHKRNTRLVSTQTAITLIAMTLIAIGAALALTAWLVALDEEIKTRFAGKRFKPPIEIYSAPTLFHAGDRVSKEALLGFFARGAFRARNYGSTLSAGDFAVYAADECSEFLGVVTWPTPIEACVTFVNPSSYQADAGSLIALAGDGKILGVFSRETRQPVAQAEIAPELFAQYYGESPVLRKIVSITDGEVPLHCRDALIAIEDARFYEHSGVSLRALARILWRNLRTSGRAQGGSTLTQQLVKNYFLTDERTLKRKLTEMAMAILIERRFEKDEILETYINLIYMGQNGPFEVRGFAAAAEHYFAKSLRDVGLAECAFLAGVLNGPGLYDPVIHPEAALKRRRRVLDRMLELGFINPAAREQANLAALPSGHEGALTEPAPYFVQTVRREISRLKIDVSEGLKIFTTLDLRAQEAAQRAVRGGIAELEKKYQAVAKLKEAKKPLEAVLISTNPHNGAVTALVGGRGFRSSPFNRAVDSRRQVGSVMKPFVYLTALAMHDSLNARYTPLSLIDDAATTHRFEGQVWKPKNFEPKYYGPVPLFFALKESLNAATVNLAMATGLDNIVATARQVGMTSPIQPFPSLALGAFELSPFEVAQAYSTLSALGRRTDLAVIDRLEDLHGKTVYQRPINTTQAVPSVATAVLVGMMKQTIDSGTGSVVRRRGFLLPAAGKTGTTNDKKDAWFAGFTANHTAVVWVGYDDNTPLGLTGALAAAPIWADYMSAYANNLNVVDFAWPPGSELINLTPQQLLDARTPPASAVAPISLIFEKN